MEKSIKNIDNTENDEFLVMTPYAIHTMNA